MTRPAQRWSTACALSGLLVWLASFGLELPISPRLGFVVAFCAVAGEILLASRLSPVLPARWLSLGVLGSLGGLVLLAGKPPTAPYAALLTCALLAGASLLGAAIGHRIEKPGHLLAVAGISGLADLWSVFDSAGGPTAQLVEKALAQPEQLALFALPFPLLGAGTIVPVIGAGDIAFTALYLACFARHGLAVRRALLGLASGYAAGLVALLLFERSVPLLPLLGAGAVLADRGARALEARELRMVTAVVLTLLGVLGARLWG